MRGSPRSTPPEAGQMEIRVTNEGKLRLLGDDDFTRFAVAVDPGAAGHVAAALGTVARLDGTDHAWITPARLRSLTPRAGQADWEEGFDAMLSYAERKGWTDAEGAIRVHIQHEDAANDELPPIDGDQFRQAMRNLAGGVAVVATGSGSGRRGLTVSAVTSVSAEPPCLLVCVNRSAEAHDVMLANGDFSVNLLGIEHKELAMRFAGQTGCRGAARFDGGNWDHGPHGLPVLEDALCSMECELLSSHEVGSHRLFVGRIVHVRNRAGEPLVNFQGRLQTLEAA